MRIDAIQIIADRFKDSRDAVCFTSFDDRDFTYGSFWLNAQKLARMWRNQGLKHNDVIAFILPNSVVVPCYYLACAIGGFIACPVVNTLHKTTIDDILSSIQPALVVRDASVIEATTTARQTDDYLLEIDQDAPFIILFTSGLTGAPKAICHSFRSVVASAHSFAHLTNMSEKTRLYHVLPMAYMAGFLNAMLAPLVAGASIVEGPLFSPSTAVDFWTRPVKQRVNTLSIIPTIASALCRLTRSAATIEAVKSQIIQVQCTSAPIPKALCQRFKGMFTTSLQDCYGVTELGGPLTFQTAADADNYCNLGVPLPEIDISLREQSELWIRSPFSMLGYLENGELVCPFDKEGFMDTGDLASQVNGKIRITGRRKDIIIRGGINISPVRVESVLSLMPDIEEVAVVGCSHDFWGEEIVACIIPGSDTSGPKNKVIRYCKENLAQHERPDRIVFMDDFPRSFIGKVQKNILQDNCLKKY